MTTFKFNKGEEVKLRSPFDGDPIAGTIVYRDSFENSSGFSEDEDEEPGITVEYLIHVTEPPDFNGHGDNGKGWYVEEQYLEKYHKTLQYDPTQQVDLDDDI
jgi:hypothetical protein